MAESFTDFCIHMCVYIYIYECVVVEGAKSVYTVYVCVGGLVCGVSYSLVL